MDLKGMKAALGDKALEAEPLSKHTTFAVGGPADLFVLAQTLPELRTYVRLSWEHRVPYFILGGGANILVADKGIRGLVIHNQCSAVEIAPGEDVETWLVRAESGAAIGAVARQAIAHGLAGLEWAVDVPGTVGGAVVGNAGAYGAYVSDSLQGVVLLSPAEGERWQPSSELKLGYRSSIFKQNKKAGGLEGLTSSTPSGGNFSPKVANFSPVILSATFALHKEDTMLIQARAAEHSRHRAETQPQGLSAGSVFKRTAQYPAGFLIENAGLKGKRIGGAIVSPQHANFIINLGTATARDVQELIQCIRETVYTKFKILLELEIELVGDW